jgi:hypothetical protein
MLTEKTLGKNGYLYLYSELQGEFSKNLQKFLFDVFNNFARYSMKYVRSDLCEFPFLYKELALSSVLIPSFQDASDSGVVLAEVPIIRRLKNEESEGRIDYIVRHKGRNILIEVKHQWISYNSIKNGIKGKDKDKNYLTKEINEVLEQIKNIDAKDWGGSDCIKLGLMVAPVYKVFNSSPMRDENLVAKFKREVNVKIIDEFFESLYDKLLSYSSKFLSRKGESFPFIAQWYIPKFFEYYFEFYDNREDNKIRYEAYPCVAFLGIAMKE